MDIRADFDVKERVRQAIDIVDLLGSYMELRRQGRQFVARCPWHDDSKPSLTINQERQSWKCWVCNIGGDIFSYVMKKENIEFREALRLLAERAGIQLQAHATSAEPGSAHDKKTLYEALAWVEKNFHECLLQADVAAPARAYLEERGISAESIAQFKIGFSPNEWTWLIDRARFTQFSPEVLEACGVLARGSSSGKLFDFFRGRVIFPIQDLQGRPIAFGARVLPQWAEQLRGKYINTAETRLFSKSDHLYALNLARQAVGATRNITVVEGYTDVVMAHQFGARDVVAVLGTALGQRHIQNLKRYADRITLVLDGDNAGQRRTNEILELFVAAQVDLRIVTLPEEFDPCELFIERGLSYWQEVLNTGVDALTHKIRVSTQGIDVLRDVHAANNALEEVLKTFALLPVDPLSGTHLRQDQMLRAVAREFRVSEENVRERLRDLRTKKSERQTAKPIIHDSHVPTDFVPDVVYAESAKSLNPQERELLELLAVHSELAITALQELGPDDFPSSAARDIFEAYRQLEEQGLALDFAVVLSAISNESLKNILVEIDHRATEKSSKALLDPAARLRTVIDKLRQNEVERYHREQLAVLEERELEDHEQKNILEQMLELKRQRLGIHLN